MSILSKIYFHIDLNLSEENQHLGKEYLETIIKNYSKTIYNQNVEIHTDIQDGSIKIWLTMIGALYLAIGQYGSFRSGIDKLIDDSKMLQKLLEGNLYKGGLNEEDILESKRINSTPDKIRRLLLRIDRYEKNYQNLEGIEGFKELENIKKSASKLLLEINIKEDYKFLYTEINSIYLPPEISLPFDLNKIDIYMRREEDSLYFPF